MKAQTEPIHSDEEKVTSLIFSDGEFEVNQELLPLIHQCIGIFELSGIEDFKRISQEEFFNFFTPLMNKYYNLK